MMNPAEDSLAALANHMRRNLSGPPGRWQEALEASLLPLIRCALRKGIGHPSVVHWVRRQAEGNPTASADPARAAVPMARALCERLMQRLDPLSGRETVVDP
jgi:hypothetical protein